MLIPVAAAAAVNVGSVLTVECTLACALTTPVRSAELARLKRHDRRNHIGEEGESQTTYEQVRGAGSSTALASLLHREICESQHDLFRREAFVPWDFEHAPAVREQRERTAGNRFTSGSTELTAQHSA